MIPDPIERMEMLTDDMAWEADYDPATGTMICPGCKDRFPEGELWPLNAHPCSPFMCDACLRARGSLHP